MKNLTSPRTFVCPPRAESESAGASTHKSPIMASKRMRLAAASMQRSVNSSLGLATFRACTATITECMHFVSTAQAEAGLPIRVFPMRWAERCLFISEKAELSQSRNVTDKASAALSWCAATLGSETDPSTEAHYRKMMAGVKLRFYMPPQAQPAPGRHLVKAWLSATDLPMPSARAQAALAVVCGTGMRLAEASALSMSDLCADQMGMQFFMRTSKADEFRNGTEGCIGRQPSHKPCLMRIIEAYILRSGLAGRTSNTEMVTPILRGLRFQKRTGASAAEAAPCTSTRTVTFASRPTCPNTFIGTKTRKH